MIEMTSSEQLTSLNLAILMNDASIDQIMAVDTDLQVIAWNKACEEVTGIDRVGAIGKSFNEVRKGADAFPGISEALVNALNGLKSFLTWEKAAYSGYFEHHFIPLRQNGRVIGVLIVIHDVAHRIKAEQNLHRLNVQLEQKAMELQEKNSELSRFNWIASHDLKEPLRKIYTFVEMVAIKEGNKLSNTARSNLRRAQSAAQRMGLLADDIASFTQVAAPNEELADINLESMIEHTLAQQQKAISDSNAVIERDTLPEIHAYPIMMDLLLKHMVSNALKFHAPDAQPKIKIEYTLVDASEIASPAAEEDAQYHRLCFTDNGIGIAEEYHEQVFGMFQRLHPQGDYKGTGMGLAICRKVAAAHQGFITLKSVEGNGSTFCCYLKVV